MDAVAWFDSVNKVYPYLLLKSLQRCDRVFSLFRGLVEREVLAGAVGEQIGGGGVCDGAADSHGKFTGEYLRCCCSHVQKHS